MAGAVEEVALAAARAPGIELREGSTTADELAPATAGVAEEEEVGGGMAMELGPATFCRSSREAATMTGTSRPGKRFGVIPSTPHARVSKDYWVCTRRADPGTGGEQSREVSGSDNGGVGAREYAAATVGSRQPAKAEGK